MWLAWAAYCHFAHWKYPGQCAGFCILHRSCHRPWSQPDEQTSFSYAHLKWSDTTPEISLKIRRWMPTFQEWRLPLWPLWQLYTWSNHLIAPDADCSTCTSNYGKKIKTTGPSASCCVKSNFSPNWCMPRNRRALSPAISFCPSSTALARWQEHDGAAQMTINLLILIF